VTSTVSNVSAVPDNADVHLHTGPSMESPAERKSIVCGDLRGQATTVRMGPPDETGDNVSGTATLNLDRASKRLTVKLVLDGLEPNTSHPAHLYVGSCDSQGPVAKPLNTV
jgi:CHRD domain